MRLLLATRNQGKITEIWDMVPSSFPLEIFTIDNFFPELKIIEDGKTFAENAQKKARLLHTLCPHLWILGEDSGLEIDALEGKPGVLSARFLGEDITQYQRNHLILEMMKSVPEERRGARFRCVMCLVSPEGEEKMFEGICEGKIAHSILGTSGFGYDPIFIPEGYTQTFGELGYSVKNRISHRAKAFRQVIEYLSEKGTKNKGLF